MKKLLALFAVFLFAAPQTRAATLWVKNQTNETIKVAVRGTHNSSRSTAKTIAAGKRASFSTLRNIGGPLTFAFKKDMAKAGFPVYIQPQNHLFPTSTLNHLFPITTFGTKEVRIRGGKIKSDGKRRRPEISWKFRRSRRDSPWEELHEMHSYHW